jgi:pyruvate dehydrogenase E1 component alpha subunit
MSGSADDSLQSYLSIYRCMVRIRTFEETLSKLFLDGKLAGFLHLYSGEEAVAAGVCACLRDDDYIVSTHRGHGHCIAKGADIKRMMAEIYGKVTGYSKGKGGSMHIADLSKGIIGANGIVGAGMPISLGAGFSQKFRKKDGVSVAFFGDGASNRGTFHESMNMASVLNLPVLFVCENNQFGMSTPFSYHSKNKSIAQRSAAYDMPGVQVDGNDPLAIKACAQAAVDRARAGKGPSLIECLTWRHYGHFVGDAASYKKAEDTKAWLAKDPLPTFRARMLSEFKVTESALLDIENAALAEVQDAIRFAEESAYPDPEVMFEDLVF